VMREMGKAMMGTGEATGEKRALTAAEAAIANPLIDDSSMKGARGLLISITGGKDLTLFEVDEAATRIREEVDQDANIIVGATFDETLDGVIRVSVVATGIEEYIIARNGATSVATNAVAPATTANSRLADLTARLRADNQRLAERAEKLETPAHAPAAPAAAPQRTTSSIERAALAAIAAAVAPEAPTPHVAVRPASDGDVTVRPIAQKPSLFPDHEVARVDPQELATSETFIPQAAERPPVRAPRMPKFEDLPMPAQPEIRQARGEADEDLPQKTRLSLLQRLANVGLGRREKETEPRIAARASGPAMPPLPPLPPFPERKGRAPADFLVIAPPVVHAGYAFVVEVWVGPSDQQAELSEQAIRKGRMIERGTRSRVNLQPDTLITILLRLPGFELTNPVEALGWNGDIANVGFIVKAPSSLRPGIYPGSAKLLQGQVPFASITFDLEVHSTSAESSRPLNVQIQRIARAFASYASQDRLEVLGRVQGMRATGVDVFLDIASLRSGADWKSTLYREIDSSDGFFLFWSKAAAKSEWVDREWRYALEQRGIDFIHPLPLEDPRMIEPPVELQSKHFNDTLLAFIKMEDMYRGRTIDRPE
jgi:cell division protein FtsZ